MKHIKSYRIFESNNLESIKHDIDDILIDITDDNSNYFISSNVGELKVDICVSFNGLIYSPIEIGKFGDNLERLIEYLESLGYKYNSSHYYDGDDSDPACPNCNSNNNCYLLDPNYYCRTCKKEFESPVKLSKSDLINVIRNNVSMDFLYLSFKKTTI